MRCSQVNCYDFISRKTHRRFVHGLNWIGIAAAWRHAHKVIFITLKCHQSMGWQAGLTTCQASQNKYHKRQYPEPGIKNKLLHRNVHENLSIPLHTMKVHVFFLYGTLIHSTMLWVKCSTNTAANIHCKRAVQDKQYIVYDKHHLVNMSFNH